MNIEHNRIFFRFLPSVRNDKIVFVLFVILTTARRKNLKS